MKIVIVVGATLAVVTAAGAADMPQPQPVYQPAPIGKEPIGKGPVGYGGYGVGKGPVGKEPVAPPPPPPPPIHK